MLRNLAAIHLMVDDIVITVIYTAAVRSSVNSLRDTLNVRHLSYDRQWPTSPALRQNV